MQKTEFVLGILRRKHF